MQRLLTPRILNNLCIQVSSKSSTKVKVCTPQLVQEPKDQYLRVICAQSSFLGTSVIFAIEGKAVFSHVLMSSLWKPSKFLRNFNTPDALLSASTFYANYRSCNTVSKQQKQIYIYKMVYLYDNWTMIKWRHITVVNFKQFNVECLCLCTC